jgi:hypothetical protein
LKVTYISFAVHAAKTVASAVPFAISFVLRADSLHAGARHQGTRTLPHPDGWIGFWKPGIGDPSIMGWITVAAYLVACAYCFRLVRDRRTRREDREGRVWRILAIGLLLLGINKQLDLQSAFTEAGRLLAREQGWYGERSIVQMAFLFFLFVLGVTGAVTIFRLTRNTSRCARAAALGSVLLIGFVVMRATSFHYVDRILRKELAGMRFNWIFELGGILIILAAARRRFSERNRDQAQIINHSNKPH